MVSVGPAGRPAGRGRDFPTRDSSVRDSIAEYRRTAVDGLGRGLRAMRAFQRRRQFVLASIAWLPIRRPRCAAAGCPARLRRRPRDDRQAARRGPNRSRDGQDTANGAEPFHRFRRRIWPVCPATCSPAPACGHGCLADNHMTGLIRHEYGLRDDQRPTPPEC
jgi:hypothetical protein